MRKSFENSSLEVQMILVVFFLMIALLYFLLILYEIIWKQKRKQILKNTAVFMATFLLASRLSVQYRFGGWKQHAVYIVVGLGEILYAVIQIRDALGQGKKQLQGNAIQESLDNLPSGVGFFDEQGMPVLINRQMYRICRYLTGRDIQSAEELWEALKHPAEEGVSYDSNFQVYCFPDESVWKFSENFITAGNGERFLQFLASEVSELYRNKQLLETENKQLQEMSAAMKELSKNIVTLTREEETLSMKMRVHDDLGYSVLAAHRMLVQDSEETKEAFLSQWNRILNLLRKDNEPAAEGLHQIVEERARILGVKIVYKGKIPDELETAEVMDMILLEALSNSVRHAGATELFVDIGSERHEWILIITNNGRKPEKEIEEGGGLSAIREKVKNYKGTVSVCSFPEYSLTIHIPKKEDAV